MSVDVLAIRVWIQAPDEVFASCAEFAGLSLDLLHPSSVSCNTCDLCQRMKHGSRQYGKLPACLIDLPPWHEVQTDCIGPWSFPLCGGIQFLPSTLVRIYWKFTPYSPRPQPKFRGRLKMVGCRLTHVHYVSFTIKAPNFLDTSSKRSCSMRAFNQSRPQQETHKQIASSCRSGAPIHWPSSSHTRPFAFTKNHSPRQRPWRTLHVPPLCMLVIVRLINLFTNKSQSRHHCFSL